MLFKPTMNSKKRDQKETEFIIDTQTKHQIFRNKFNQWNERSLQWNLSNIGEINHQAHTHTKLKDVLCSCIRSINGTKMCILPKAIYGFNVISIKISMALFAG